MRVSTEDTIEKLLEEKGSRKMCELKITGDNESI